jgi:DNA-directed RNA polymerase specialized sigma24 family protein
MPDSRKSPDAEPAASPADEEVAPLADLFDDHGSRLYSYAEVMLGDQELASAAVEESFVTAAERLANGERLEGIHLFTIARAEVRARPRVPRDDTGPPAGRERDLRQDVLDATDGLGERDREVMVLSLVEGLTDAELAEVMGLDEVDAAALVSGARGRVDRVLGSLLIARLGSEACPEMTELRKDWDRSFTDGFRTRVSQHVGGCEICKTRRAVLLEPATVLAKVMALDSPPDLRQRVLDRVFPPRLEAEATMAATVAAAVITPPAMPVVTPAPVPTEPPPVTPALEDPVPLSDTAKFAILGAVALALGLIGVAVSAGFGPLDRPEVTTIAVSPGSGSTTTTFTDPASPTPRPEASASTTAPDTPVALGVSVETLDFGVDGTTGEFDIVNSGGRAAAFEVEASTDALALTAAGGELGAGETVTYQVALDRAAVTEGEIAESITVRWPGGEARISIAGVHRDNPILHSPQSSPAQLVVAGDGCAPTQSTVTVRVTDSSPLDRVVVRWSPDGGSSSESEMLDVGNDMFEGVVGPFTAPQAGGVRVVAFDEAGNAGGATSPLTVVACP